MALLFFGILILFFTNPFIPVIVLSCTYYLHKQQEVPACFPELVPSGGEYTIFAVFDLFTNIQVELDGYTCTELQSCCFKWDVQRELLHCLGNIADCLCLSASLYLREYKFQNYHSDPFLTGRSPLLSPDGHLGGNHFWILRTTEEILMLIKTIVSCRIDWITVIKNLTV